MPEPYPLVLLETIPPILQETVSHSRVLKVIMYLALLVLIGKEREWEVEKEMSVEVLGELLIQ